MRTAVRTKIAVVAASLLTVIAIAGCQTEEKGDEYPWSDNPQESDNKTIPINVKVDGVEDFYGGAVTRGGKTKEDFIYPMDSARDTGYEFITTYESIAPEPAVQTRATLANVRFRLLAYKNGVVSTANYAGQCDYLTNGSGVAAAQTTPINLSPGTYKFVCYSYGASAAIPAFNGASATTVPVSQGTDFSTWASTSTVAADANGNFTLTGVTFTRQCAQLEICVDFQGSSITACIATVAGLSNNSANYTIGGNLSATGNTYTANASWTNPNSVTVNSNKLTVLPMGNQPITIKLTTLTAGGKNYHGQVSVTTANRAFTAGGNYRVTIKVEKDAITACNYDWAKGNLSGNGTRVTNQTDRGALFGWNTTSTGTAACNNDNYSKANDPCQALPPVGTWYTPSEAQLTNLMNCNQGSFTDQGKYFASSAIFLPAAGFRGSGGTMSDVGTYGNYWSRAPYNIFAYSLYFYSSNVGVGSYNYRNNGMSVRCVKGE